LSDQPPKIAERLLRRLVPGREGEIIAGDLREEFRERGGGRLWYWKEALSCAAVRFSPHRLTAPDLRQDLHYAVRLLRRNPGYAATAMVCLALWIGVNATVFGMVNELFWQPLPVPHSDRVAVIGRPGEESTCSYRDYLEFQRRSGGLLSGLLAYDEMPTSVDSEGVSRIAMAEAVSANYADVLQLPAQAGRWFHAEDERPGADPVVVLGDGAWSRRFGRSPSAIGQRLRIESRWYRIIGVAPAGFIGVSPPHTAEVWLPLLSQAYVQEALANAGERERPRVRLMARLAPGRSLRAVESGLRTIDAQILREFPRENPPRGGLTADVAAGASMPAVREFAGMMAALLLGVTGIVLLIACVNIANLLLARSAVRRREMAVRQALGASRWRLARQTLAEGLTISVGGAALGLFFGYFCSRLLARSLPALPHIGMVTLEGRIDGRVAVFAAAIGLVSALLFSFAPAIEQSRVGLTAWMKGDGPSKRLRQRDVYVVAQVALSLVLLIAATLLLRALGRAQQVEPGYAMAGRLAARIYVSEPEYSEQSGRLFFDRALARVRSTPGVRSATLSYTVPLGFSNSACVASDATMRRKRVSSDVVVPGYFDTIGIPIIRGRQFTSADSSGAPRVAVVNQTFADRYWPGENAIGKTLWLGCDQTRNRTQAQVVGVARDAKYEALDEAPRPVLYTPLAQDWVGFMAMIVETSGNPGDFTTPLRGILHELDPSLRVYEIETLEQYAAESLWKTRWQASLLAVFGFLAMALAAVGLYGVVAYSVAQRTREIGVRLAMGAQRGDVMWMVLGRGLGLTAAGIALGVVLSAMATRLIGRLLLGLSPLDPVSFGAASLAWLGIAMLATYVPARRAMRVDPVVALRWE
jgi:macrolide transport system ATP-binding/permease protein